MLKGRGQARLPLDKFYENPFNEPDKTGFKPDKEQLLIKNLVKQDTPYATGVSHSGMRHVRL